MFRRRERGFAGLARLATLAALAAAFPVAGASAGDSAPAPAPPDEGIVQSLSRKVENVGLAKSRLVHPLAKALGVGIDPGPAADFVVKARPADEEEYIPVGRVEAEHAIKPKTAAQLKAMEAEFDQVKTRHDALRSAFPPAVKAVAEAQAAKSAKTKKTAPPAPANAQ